MHTRPAMPERRVEHVVKATKNIVGVEHGILGNLTQAVGTVAHDIAERPRKHAHLAMKRGHAA